MSLSITQLKQLGCLLAGLVVALPAAAESPVPPAGTVRPMAQAEAPASPVTSTPTDESNTIRVLLSPEQETTLSAQMVGRISKLQAQLGKQVKSGQAVVSFDCSEAAARLSMARAEYTAAKETLTAKQRLRKLDAAGDMEVTMANANADKGKAAIAISQAQLAQCTVNAPFDGHIVKVYAKQHQSVNIGAPLIELIADGPLKLRLNVPSRWLRQLQVGTQFDVTINETGRSYPATVSLINARVDAVAQTIELEARMVNAEPDLLAGMSGVARFSLSID